MEPEGSQISLTVKKTTTTKKNPSNRIRDFNPKVNYEFTLKEFREEFENKWEQNIISPSIGLKGYYPIAILGKGAFGKVILVNEIGSPFNYACKILDKEYLVKKKQVNHTLSEKKILSCIDFPNLIKLIFSRKDNDNLYIGLPFLIGGELFTYHRVLGRFQESEARFYVAQVYLALEYLHNVQVIYRDLKPENICFERNGYITITDFGFAKRVISRTMTLCGTPEYLAPEILHATPYGASVDWWGLGILIYEFVNGSSPFSIYSINVMLMYEKIIDGEYAIPDFFSKDLKELIGNLLIVDVTKRLGNVSGKQIKKHNWFKDVDWFAILNQKIRPPYVPHIKHNRDVSHFSEFSRYVEIEEGAVNQHKSIFEGF